jgi:hypothetical protein
METVRYRTSEYLRAASVTSLTKVERNQQVNRSFLLLLSRRRKPIAQRVLPEVLPAQLEILGGRFLGLALSPHAGAPRSLALGRTMRSIC